MLTILKRFEIWLLFALIGVAIWWALGADPNPVSAGATKVPDTENGGSNTNTTTAVEQSQSLLEVKKVDFTPEAQGGVVEVTLLGRSGTDEQVTLDDRNIEMLTSEGETIRRFFVPFSPDPQLAPNESSMVTLKYWLPEAAEVLWLTYRDQTLKVILPSA